MESVFLINELNVYEYNDSKKCEIAALTVCNQICCHGLWWSPVVHKDNVATIDCLVVFQAQAASQHPTYSFAPKLEAETNRVTHIRLFLLFLGCDSPPPSFLCATVALFPSAYCFTKRTQLPADLPQPPFRVGRTFCLLSYKCFPHGLW